MTTTKPNKHEQKTQETRARLLLAAEQLILRNGYEKADMAQVASLAGRTTGAIYAHFKSKEEIFLALFDQSLERKRQLVDQLLQSAAPAEVKREHWRRVLIEISKDRDWSLLLLEYKLFAIRHAEAQEQLRNRIRRLFGGGADSIPQRMLESTGNNAKMEDRLFAVQMMQPLLSALAVECLLFPNEIDEPTVERYLLRIFDCML